VQIRDLAEILADPQRLLDVIRTELEQIRDVFADKRRTEIITNHEDLCTEDLITPEDVVVTLSHGGYAKAQPVSDYQAQRRGGRGKAATSVKDEDWVDKLFVANTHDTLLCFSDHGKLYWLKVYQLPQASRGSRGRPIVNLLPLQEGERISALLSIKDFDEGKFVFMATSLGTVKKTPLALFSRPRANGIIAVALDEGDKLVGAAITDGTKDILLFTSGGKAIRFVEDEVRPMGREAAGVRGVRLSDEHRVNALIVAEQGYILTASENGFGKLTPLEDFPTHGRGGQGVIALQVTDRNGRMIGALQVSLDDEIMLMSQAGVLVRTPVKDISVVGRNTQGVRLIRLEGDDQLSGLERIDGIAGDPDTEGSGTDGAGAEGLGTEAPDAEAPDAETPDAEAPGTDFLGAKDSGERQLGERPLRTDAPPDGTAADELLDGEATDVLTGGMAANDPQDGTAADESHGAAADASHGTAADESHGTAADESHGTAADKLPGAAAHDPTDP
jgi:DNA gyrase subunit A